MMPPTLPPVKLPELLPVVNETRTQNDEWRGEREIRGLDVS
jgi:hypothetical protein